MQEELLRSGTTSSEITYYIYRDTDGTVFVETLCNRHYTIAQSVDEFYNIPESKLESLIYCAEMSVAR